MSGRGRVPVKGLDVFFMDAGGEPLVAISLPAHRPDALGALNAAEREVAHAAVAGLSTAAIARRRGRSPRTIANQLQSIYRKLGVSSRAELATRLLGDS